MPAVPSTLQQLSEALREMPLKDIANGINKIVARLGTMLENDDTKSIADNFSGALDDLRKVLRKSDEFIAHLDKQVDPMSADMAKAPSADADSTLEEIKRTVSSVGKVFESDSQGKQEFRALLVSLKEAADRVKDLCRLP